MKYDLFLDDERAPAYINTDHVVVVCRTMEQFISTVVHLGLPQTFHLDHDLGLHTGSGADCIKWLIENFDTLKVAEKAPVFEVHSQNPIGRANILGYIKDFNRLWAQRQVEIS